MASREGAPHPVRRTRRSGSAAGVLLLALVTACASDEAARGDETEAVAADAGRRERRPPSATGADADASGDPSASSDASASTADGAANVGDASCDCPPGFYCGPTGACVEGCEPGSTRCASETTIGVCSDSGDDYDIVDCTDGWICEADRCVPPDCEPDEVVGCQQGMLLVCDDSGASVHTALCPPGEGCFEGVCEPIYPNVLLLVDTSSSMNWTPGGTQPDECGSSCWPWSYPSCDDDPAGPQTRLGRVKEAMRAILAGESASGVRIALQRFPQRIYTALPPECDGGYWTGNTTLEGDEEYHALARNWLAQRLPQIILEPFPPDGETTIAELSRWFDTEEELVSTGLSCSDNDDCDNTPCLGGECMAFENPELWGMGLTPLGKSLFYAGEYMRHFVLVEGRGCETDADCGSANYECSGGACHDPFHHCRPNVIIAFTDGEETEHFYTDDFFHPRVQAKRLHYGLGCEGDADCGASAACEEGVCRPPAGVIDETQRVCDANDVPCAADSDCGAFRCRPARLDFIDPAGEDHLEDAAGNVISLTVHVVDASNVPDANNLVAAYGGGQHFSVDLDDPEEILATLEELLGDAKESFDRCLGE